MASDDAAGTARLTWTQYLGEMPFGEYRVLRNEAERTRVETLAGFDAVGRTGFTDSSMAPNTSYDYRVSAVNNSGYEIPSETVPVAGYKVEPVLLLSWQMDTQQGAVELRWNQYRNARFEGYRVERRGANEAAFSSIARLRGP